MGWNPKLRHRDLKALRLFRATGSKRSWSSTGPSKTELKCSESFTVPKTFYVCFAAKGSNRFKLSPTHRQTGDLCPRLAPDR